MYDKKLEQYIIKESDSVYEAYWKYKHNKHKILIVVNDNEDFIGVVTANEINKMKYNKESFVGKIVNKDCKSIQYNDNHDIMDDEADKIFSLSNNINCIPVIQGKNVMDIYTREAFKKNKGYNSAVSDIKGNYKDFVKNIVNEYLCATYNLNIEKLDDLIKKHLINCKKIYEKEIDFTTFYFEDSVVSNTVDIVSMELNDTNEYNFKDMNFKEGDIVVDIGGNVGMVSIYLAKKYPFLKIYAYEPVLQNYESFLHNIKLNNIPDGIITVENKAVTGDGRNIDMLISPTNLGACAISDVITDGYVYDKNNTSVKSTTLNEIFKTHNIKELRLLKIDCEGSEYEILQNADIDNLKKIKSLRGEFHSNKVATEKFDIEKLYNYVCKYIEDVNVCKFDEYPVELK